MGILTLLSVELQNTIIKREFRLVADVKTFTDHAVVELSCFVQHKLLRVLDYDDNHHYRHFLAPKRSHSRCQSSTEQQLQLDERELAFAY